MMFDYLVTNAVQVAFCKNETKQSENHLLDPSVEWLMLMDDIVNRKKRTCLNVFHYSEDRLA